MNGQLSEHPLAELIREISGASISGALRLKRERVKLVIYFEQGNLYYATSNVRGHRLSEVLKRLKVVTKAQLAELDESKSEAELESQLLQRGAITAETLNRVRTERVTDILRVPLLWTDGYWDFDARVRLAGDIRVRVNLEQLLMESARRLPDDFVNARLIGTGGIFSQSVRYTNGTTLSPVEAFVLSRAQNPTNLSELTALSGVGENQALRAIYALSLGGLLERSAWPAAISAGAATWATSSQSPEKKEAPAISWRAPVADKTGPIEDEARELKVFFERLDHARDHFEVLDVGRGASPAEIKRAYHMLARRFHPDRFHQSDRPLRARVDSAFARIAQAYETLGDSSLRAAYEAKLRARPVTGSNQSVSAFSTSRPKATVDASASSSERAAAAFEKGLLALKQNQADAATMLFAEAAHLAPSEAGYRAQYGQALAKQRKSRRLAETELQAAVSLEPNNAAFRIMLAELYKNVGLRRRALAELERALMADPKNKKAREMLVSLQEKS